MISPTSSSSSSSSSATTTTTTIRSITSIVIPLILAILTLPLYQTILVGDPLSHVIPNTLLFTGFRQWTYDTWVSTLDFNSRQDTKAQPIAEIQADEYSFDELRRVTRNFRDPAVVRGLFNGTKALETWGKPGVLGKRVGDFIVPVIEDGVYRTVRQRKLMKIADALDEIMKNPNSKKYLFVPNHSRRDNTTYEGPTLKKRINKVVLEDLEIDKRIAPGFGTEGTRGYFGAQIIAGQGKDDPDETTGTDWHCAIGSNYFIQIVGTKRWYFMDPKYSSWMHPLKGGRVHFVAGNNNMSELQRYLPVTYVDLKPGDILYNPDWHWHAIKNHKGLSLAIPLRELRFLRSARNNLHFTSIVTVNRGLEKIGLTLGGYPPENDH